MEFILFSGVLTFDSSAGYSLRTVYTRNNEPTTAVLTPCWSSWSVYDQDDAKARLEYIQQHYITSYRHRDADRPDVLLYYNDPGDVIGDVKPEDVKPEDDEPKYISTSAKRH